MKETPLRFTPENAQKVHDGSKTMTRRLNGLAAVNASPDDWESGGVNVHGQHIFYHKTDETEDGCLKLLTCPYGGVGDQLWVREALTYWENNYQWKPQKGERFEHLPLEQQAEIIAKSDDTGHDYLVYKGGGEKRPLSEWKYPHPIYEHCVGRFGKTVPATFMPKWACRTWLELTGVRVEQLGRISEEDARAEGVKSVEAFIDLWKSINKTWEPQVWTWVLEYRKVTP